MTPAQPTEQMGIDPQQPDAVAPTGEQVAMGAGTLARITLKSGRKKIDDTVSGIRNRNKGPKLEPDQLDEILQQYATEPVPTEKLNETRNININRHHQGAPLGEVADMSPMQMMSEMKTSDDIARMLEVVGRYDSLSDAPRSHEEVKASSDDVLKVLKPIASGEQLGLMTDVQLHAARRLLTTIGETTTELANRIVKGDNTPETLLEYQQAGEQFRTLQKFVSGNVKETARALAQQRMISESLNSMSGVLMDEALNGAGGSMQQIIAHAQMVADAMSKEGADLSTLASKWDSMRRYGVGLMVEYWKANILSGVQTHAVNVASNAALNVYSNAVVMPLAAAVGSVRRALGGEAGVRHGEAVARLTGSFAGLRDGVRLAAQNIRTGESTFGATKVEQQSRMAEFGANVAGTAGEAIGTALSMPLRMLGAEDEFFKAIAVNQELPALAYRAGVNNGLEGDALAKFINETVTNPPDELFAEALKRAQELTLTNQPDAVAGVFNDAMQKIVAEVPEFAFLTPFIKTPINLASRAIEMSALAVTSPRLWKQIKAGGAQADVAVAKMASGIALTTMMWQLFESGNLTGGGPENHNIRRMYEKTGWRPHAVRFGDTYYSLDRLDPFGLSLAMVGDLLEDAKFSRSDKEAQEFFLYAAFYMAENLTESTYMRGIDDFLNAVEYKGEAVKRLLSNYGSGFVPFSGALNTAKKLNDPQPRRQTVDADVEGGGERFSQTIRNRTPWMSQESRPARYWDGEVVIPDGGSFTYAVSPMQIGRGRRDFITEELIQNGISVGEPQPRVTVAGVQVSLAEMDEGRGQVFDRYIELLGKRRREYATAVVRSDSYRELTRGFESERYVELQKAMMKAKRDATAEFMFETLPAMVRRDPKLHSQIAKHIGMAPEHFFEMASEFRLPEPEQSKVKVRGKEGDTLPLPPHAAGIKF